MTETEALLELAFQQKNRILCDEAALAVDMDHNNSKDNS